MWLQFMNKLDVIESVNVLKTASGHSVQLEVLPLGPFRSKTDRFAIDHPDVVAQERFIVRWSKNGKVQQDLNDQLSVDLKGRMFRDRWTVEVEFQTPMVRSDPRKLLHSTRTIQLP